MHETPIRQALPDWPRLMGEQLAAAYLGIGVTTLNEKGPAPRRDPDKIGKRKLWDIHDLDRWADALDGQPLTDDQAAAESREVERRFIERMEREGSNNG